MIINNPIPLPGNAPIRDPMILPLDGKYYMVGTGEPFWEGANPGVKLWESDDLVNWKFVKLLIDASKIPEDKPYKDRFWAPEIFFDGKKFFLTFNAHCEKIGPLHETLRSWVAVSNTIDGDYKICEDPLLADTTTNDANMFRDDDGQIYVFLTVQPHIVWLKFDPETLHTTGEPHTVISAGKEGEWDSTGIEGSFVLKRNGLYYHWYSSWTRSYEMGLAVTDDLNKPFRKLDCNPVISGYKKNTKMPYCGHNSCFTLPDGTDAVAFHASGDDFRESLCINRVEYPITKTAVPEESFIL